MPADFISNLYVFILAGFVGFEVIRRVSPLLHTPLMSLTNALDAIVVVAAIIIAGRHETTLTTVLGAIAVAASFSNMAVLPDLLPGHRVSDLAAVLGSLFYVVGDMDR